MSKKWIIRILSLFRMPSKIFLTAIIATGIMLVANASIYAQKQKVSGVVTDAATGEAIIGANVIIEGTTTGTVTDINGKFTIDVPNLNVTLVVSYLGYLPEKVTAKGPLTLKLVSDVKNLEEVVVVGYGTQKRSDITGSVTTVSADRLTKVPVTNVMTAIEGSVAGVKVVQTSSVPGSTSSMQIRGVNSINASNSPLVIVDGIPFESSTNYINPNDIETMEILKDASSTAIYGTRGSNGVILITTKKGKTGKPIISYSAYTGIEGMSHVLTPRSPEEYLEKYKYYMEQTNQTYDPSNPVPNAYELTNYEAGKTVDWIKAVTQTGLIQNHTLSLNGGTDNVKYYVSADYLNEKGVVKGYQYKRAGIRSNIDANVTSFLSSGFSFSGVYNNYDGGRANLLNASAMSPYAQEYNEETGKYEIYPMYPELLYTNPLLGLYKQSLDRRWNLNGNFYAEVKPEFLPGFKYRLNASYTYNPTRASTYSGRDANSTLGEATITNSETNMWIIENIASYTKDIDKHHFDLTGLYSAQQSNYSYSYIYGTNFINDGTTYNDIGSAATINASSSAWKKTMKSQMGRLNYSYDSRYLFTATARRDAYSAFGSNTNKYGMFPSVALGWNIANERFMEDIQMYVDKLKLRASYGKTGNMAIDANQTTSTSTTGSVSLDGERVIGTVASIMGNKDLHWETSVGFNLGVDFSVLKSRISGSVEVYKTHTNGLLMERSIPVITGYSSVWDNIGKTNNIGIDLTLNTVNVKTESFKWETNANFSAFRNKIIDLYGDKTDNKDSKLFIGQPISVIYDYKMIGVWQKGEEGLSTYDASPGDLKFKDVNNDGVIDSKDKVIQGSTYPKWTGGITNTFQYKNLTLSIFIQTFQGALKNNSDLNYSDEQGRRNTPKAVGYWTEDNKSNTRPSLAYSNTKGYGYPSDNSYTRIKDVTLSYSLPQSMLSKILLSNLTFYISGRNLYTFTKWIGWDPEMTYYTRGSSDWSNNYPNVRSFVFGINASLK
jgi:TonB-linked SusC/RagA family outer membrane protein